MVLDQQLGSTMETFISKEYIDLKVWDRTVI